MADSETPSGDPPSQWDADLTDVLDALSDVFYVFTADGEFRYWNDAVSEVLGYTDDEMADLSPLDFFLDSDAERVTAAVDRCLETGEAVTVEAPLVTSTGETIPYELSGVPLHSGTDEVSLIAGVGRDVTDRLEREADLNRLTREYESIFEANHDGIFLVDIERDGDDVTFRFEASNPSHEEMTDIASEELAGQTPVELLGESEGTAVRERYRRCLEAGEPITYEESIEFPTRQTYWQTKLSPVVIDGEVQKLVGSAREITERKQREAELRRQMERLEEFASVVSHDLRNPLNVAKSRIELAGDECDSEHLDSVADSLDRMADIIDDTLVLARQGQTVGEPERVAADEVVWSCWDNVATADATLELVDSFGLRADPDRLRHVLENLYRNAVEHGGETVTVRVGRLPDGFYVEDDGPGIPPEDREEVFEPGRTSDRRGTGFGLTIVRRIAEAHGWEVAITESESGGARFEFTGVDLVD